jgi:dynein assembly factor 2, axonemal
MLNKENSRAGPAKLDENRVTREEFRNIVKAMDREGFENIMEEYVKEISNPDNVAETNQYLKEAEKTNDLPKNVKLAQPKKGFSIRSEKFSLKRPALRQKTFINICSLDQVNPPKEDSNNMWSLPHLLNKGRNDQDKKGNVCMTFDVIFNPLAIKLANDNMAFKKFVCDTAINGINNNILKASGEKISGDFILKNKLDYKGKEVALMNVHSLTAGQLDSRMEPSDEHKTSIQKEIDSMKEKKDDEDEEEKNFNKPDLEIDESHKEINYPIAPKYKIKYSDQFEMHKFFYDPSVTGEAQYKRLVIDIEVPLIENLGNAELHLDSKKLILKYKEFYDLNIDLPVEVDNNKSDAKFDRKKHLLTVSALIVRKNKEVLKLKEDENIEIVTEESEKKSEEEEKIKKDEESKKLDEKPEIATYEKSKEPEHINKQRKLDEQIPTNQENKRELLELNDTSKNDSIKLKSEENNEIEKNSEVSVTDKKEQITSVAKVSEIIKDEDDLPDTDNKNFDNLNSSNQLASKNQEEDLIKISYLNFNCEIIYEID